jgi:hypothetical protein
VAHFALIDQDDLVQNVIVIDNNDCGGGDFPDSEAIGQAFIASIGLPGEWRQTSYNSTFRGTYAGIGWRYDREHDLFEPPAAPPDPPEPD